MDPISLATAAITIGGLGFTAANLGKLMQRTVEDFKDFDRDISIFAVEFRVFSNILDLTMSSVDRTCRGHPGLATVRFIEDTGLAQDLGTSAKDIQRRIRNVRNHFKRVTDKHGVGATVGKLWWSWSKKPVIMQLQPRMNGLQIQLQLVLTILDREIADAQPDSPDKTAEINNINERLMGLEKTVKAISNHFLLQQETAPIAISNSTQSTTKLQLNINKVLLELGKSLQETGRIPEIPNPGRDTRSRRHPRRPEPERELPQQNRGIPRRSPTEPGRELRRSRPASNHIREEVRPSPDPPVTIPESVLKHGRVPRQNPSSSPPLERPRESIASNGSTVTTRAISSSTASRPPSAPITPVSPVLGRAESSFTDVRESRTHHRLDGLGDKAVDGYVRLSGWTSDPVHVTARYYSKLEENFISSRMAAHLGLEAVIDPRDSEAEEGVMPIVVTNDGREKQAVGSVRVDWSTAARWPLSSRSPLRLNMWVVDDALPEGPQIVLGRPFEKKLRHYSRSHGTGAN